jgi:putative transcriptional regulator
VEQHDQTPAPHKDQSGRESSVPQQSPAPLDTDADTLKVEFRAEALARFNQLFPREKRAAVLGELVDRLDDATTIEDGSAPLKQLSIDSVHFRFVDMASLGYILVESLHKDGDEPPPPSKWDVRNAIIKGMVSGAIRWVLGEIFGKIFEEDRFVFPPMVDMPGRFIDPLSSYVTSAGSSHDPWHRPTKHRTINVGALLVRELGRPVMSVRAKAMPSDRITPPIKSSKRVVDGEVLTTFEVPISRTVDVRSIRAKLGMTQETFAREFGLSLASLRNWEQGTRTPERPIALYLRLIDKFPDEVRREVEAMRLATSSDT